MGGGREEKQHKNEQCPLNTVPGGWSDASTQIGRTHAAIFAWMKRTGGAVYPPSYRTTSQHRCTGHGKCLIVRSVCEDLGQKGGTRPSTGGTEVSLRVKRLTCQTRAFSSVL